MLRYSFNALKALPNLFSYRNEVDIYTEDRYADKEFYKTLFKNLLRDTLQINDITPMGCKANVLNAYDQQNKKDKRKKFFIVDGDLDLIIGTNRKNENNLIILKSYCIENYLIDEDGALEIIYYSNGTESKDTLKAKLNFHKWLGYNSNCLIKLFFNFGILRKYGGGPVLSNANCYIKINGKQTILDSDKIDQYTSQIKSEIMNLFRGNPHIKNINELYEKEIKELENMWNYSSDTLLRIVSGKNYLLPLMQFRINHCIEKNKALIPKDSFKLFLAAHSSLNRLSYLRDRLNK